MIVTKDLFPSVIKKLCVTGSRSIDTETTGLKWYDQDHLFSIIIADTDEVYYFNFNGEPDHLGVTAPADTVLPREWLKAFEEPFQNPDSLWFAHNAKFDLGMLARDGLWLAGIVHCTEVVARLLRSDFMKYNLASCVDRMCVELRLPNIAKSDAVYDYVMKHKLYREVRVEGKEKPILELHYHKAPFKLIVPYGETDGLITRKLGIYQVQKVEQMASVNPQFWELVNEERRLVKTALKMAKAGLPFDEPYVRRALAAETAKLTMVAREYQGITGREFVDSGVQFAEVFSGLGIPYKKTDKGNPRFDEYALDTMPAHAIVDLIKAHRSSQKLVSTYYSSFLYYGAQGRIFADMRQAGTTTGRVSYREPNMQNVPKEEDPAQEFRVRACFIPPPGQVLFMPDYDQMEYRMMLDDAEEKGVIDLILQGLDVHTATAQMMNVGRREAKTINFLLLYGGGAQKLANALGITYEEACELKALYFARLPNVKKWINGTISRARASKYVKNWDGRIVRIMDQNYAYKAPNYKIQGGCAGIVKKAMNQIDDFLVGKKANSSMILQVHDELLFTMPREELDLQPEIIKIMEKIYPHKQLPLTAGPGHSWTNWADKKDGFAS
jgi:DNA polymerase-1